MESTIGMTETPNAAKFLDEMAESMGHNREAV